MPKPKRRDGASLRGGTESTSPTPSKQAGGAALKPARKSWRARAGAVVFGLCAAFALLVVLEVGLHVFGYGHSTAFLIRPEDNRAALPSARPSGEGSGEGSGVRASA